MAWETVISNRTEKIGVKNNTVPSFGYNADETNKAFRIKSIIKKEQSVFLTWITSMNFTRF